MDFLRTELFRKVNSKPLLEWPQRVKELTVKPKCKKPSRSGNLLKDRTNLNHSKRKRKLEGVYLTFPPLVGIENGSEKMPLHIDVDLMFRIPKSVLGMKSIIQEDGNIALHSRIVAS